MAKKVDDSVLDASLAFTNTEADRITFCDAEPATYAAATTLVGSGGNQLAEGSWSAGALSNDPTSGRRLTVPAGAGVTPDVNGTVTHLAIVDDTLGVLLYVTTTNSFSISVGTPFNYDPFDIAIDDPV